MDVCVFAGLPKREGKEDKNETETVENSVPNKSKRMTNEWTHDGTDTLPLCRLLHRQSCPAPLSSSASPVALLNALMYARRPSGRHFVSLSLSLSLSRCVSVRPPVCLFVYLSHRGPVMFDWHEWQENRYAHTLTLIEADT